MNIKLLKHVIKTYKPMHWMMGFLSDPIYFEFRDQKRFTHGRCLDIGCGEKPLKKFYQNVVSHHIGIDHPGTLHKTSSIDIFATAYHIPFKTGSFDSAICNAVLEHLEEPSLAIQECFRILKPGAYAVYSIPFIWHIHEEPRDFFRYSKFGIEYLFKKAGFEIAELRAASGFWGTFGQLLVYNLYRLNRGLIRKLRIIDVVAIILQAFFLFFDKFDKTEQYTWLYIVVGKKPETRND